MPSDALSGPAANLLLTNAYRPPLMGTRHMAVAGHYGAAHAAFAILEAGGNVIDAGVAAGIALGVLQCDLVNVAGVAPIMVFEAESGRVHCISGLGHWPRLTDVEVFKREYDGAIPEGILRTVVPAGPEAWITALRRFGSMSFGEVAAAAVRFAANGFPTYPLLAEMIALHEPDYRRWPTNSAIYLPNGKPPKVGEIFVQADLGRTLQYMIDQERSAAANGRDAGLIAARDAFYRGDIATTIVRFHKENGGWMRENDLAEFRAEIGPPVKCQFAGIDVYACGPWCQGPALLQSGRRSDQHARSHFLTLSASRSS
jgi:gamma-glutamyltranspeptidase / glutathione hydrolase